MSCCVAYLGVVSSLSLVSVMYVPTQSQLQELDLQTLMWGDNALNWERLHVTVTLETKKLAKSGCEYGVSLLPVDSDGFPLEIETGQLRELGCATQICAFVDGVKVCDVNENPESDFRVDTVMGKCHMSIPTALAYSTNTKRFVGLNATWLHSDAGNYTCEITHLDDMTLTVTLEPFTAMYDCEDNFFWSHQDEECKPCQNEDILSLCPPGHFVRGCDALAHVGESYCSPCENTPANFDAGFYAWHPTSECVLECVNNQQYQYFMNGTVCSPCTQSLRICSEDPGNHCCAKTAGKMWQACTSSQNEQCVDCPEILKLQYSQNEVHIPWTSDCESYFIQSFYTLPKEPPYCECQTTCIDNHYRSLTIPNVPCVPCSTGQELLLTAESSAEAGETYKFQQCTKASNTQILQCERKELGCDGIPYSGKVFDVCDVCGGDNTTCTGCDGVVASGKENDECGICDGDSTTCQGCDGVPNSGLVEDVCGQCGGDNTSCWGCDNVSNSGLVFDACGECGGDGSSCWGCDNVSNSGLVFDACGKCGGNNTTCTGCDGVLFSGKMFDSCGVCDGGDQAQDGCGVCFGDNTSCVGCDGILKSGIFNDSCGICGGDNSTCAGCDGIPYSGKVIDFCNVCGGDNTSCIGCDGVFYSGIKYDECNVCGGDNTSCECDIGYTGPRYGKLSDSCVPCGPGTYKKVIGSASCTECGFNTYNPEYGSTSSDACLPCMEHSETEEIYGHESIHACMCKSGYYHDTLTSCSACIPGTFNAEKNQTQCSNCSAGYHSNGPNSSTCEICPNATYSHEGSALCTQCNLNASSPQGSASIQDCQCTLGHTNTVMEQNTIPVGTVSLVVDSGVPFELDGMVMISDTHAALFDTPNRCLKVLNIVTGLFTTVAGNCNGVDVRVDGIGTNARFKESQEMVISHDKTTIYIPEYKIQHVDTTCAFCSIRKVLVDGWVVSTLGCQPTHHFHSLAINSHDEIFGMSDTYDDYDHPARISKCNPVSGDVTIMYNGNNNYPCSGIGVDSNYKTKICRQSSPLFVTPDDRLFVLDAHNVHTGLFQTAIIKEVVSESIVFRSYYDWYSEADHWPLMALALNNEYVIMVSGVYNQHSKVVKMHIDTGSFTHIGNYQHRVQPIALYYGNNKLLAGSWNDRKIWTMSLDTGSTQVTVGHCQACAAGTYKYVLGPQACELCASCPAGQYRLNCTASNPGSCVNCDSCPQGQFNSGCEGQSAGTCVDCSTRALSCGSNMYLVNCGGTYAGTCTQCASCPSGQYRQNCVGSNPGICVDVIEGDVRLTSCAASGNCRVEVFYSGAWGSICENSFGQKWGQAEADLACRQIGCSGGVLWNSFCSADNSCGTSGPIWLEMKGPDYCVGGESHLLDCNEGLGDQNSCTHDNDVTAKCTGLTFVEGGDGFCNSCFSCPAGQERVGCHTTSAGTCEACSAGKYKVGASAQPCRACSHCPAGEERVNCTDNSAGMCVACPTGTYKVNVSAQLCQPCPSCPPNSTSMGCGGANVGSCVVNVTNPDAEGITTTLLGTFGQSGCPSVGDVGSAVKFQEPTAAIGLPNDLAAVADPSCQKVYFFNLNDNSLIWASATLSYPWAFCKSPSGDVLYIVDNTNRIRKVDMTADTYLVTDLAYYNNKYLSGCAVTSDGNTMIIGFDGTNLGNGIFEVAINNPTVVLIEYTGPRDNHAVTISADDSTIFYNHEHWGELRKITRGDANSMTSWATTIGSKTAQSILFSADETFAYVKTWRTIQKVSFNGNTVINLIGDPINQGYSDTPGSELFDGPTNTMGYVKNGMYFLVADRNNKVIRKVSTGLDGVRTITT